MEALYMRAALAAQDVYEKNTDLGTTEFNLEQHNDMQILSIAGTNELSDWSKNLNQSSKDGIKRVAVEAALEVYTSVEHHLHYAKPLMVVGHSKAGASAIAFKKMFNADYCMAFCPARSLRINTDRHMENTFVFIDPDDWVPKMGWARFGHPIATRITFKNNFGLNPSQHSMVHIIDRLDAKEYITKEEGNAHWDKHIPTHQRR